MTPGLHATPGGSRRSILFWLVWHTLVVVALAAVAFLVAGLPTKPSPALAQGAALVAGYLVLSLYIVPVADRSRTVLALHLAITASLLFGGAFVLLSVARLPVSPWVLGFGGLAATVAAAVPHLARRLRLPLAAGLMVAAAAAAVALRPAPTTTAPDERTTGSALYTLALITYPSLTGGTPAADGGAIESVGAALMLATGDGGFHWLVRDTPQARLSATALNFPAPANRAAYLADFPDPSKAPRLRLTDIVFDPGAQPARLYAAHQAWNTAGRCYTMRVSVLALTWAGGRPAASGLWQTLFDSQPCVTADEPFDDSETGGRIAWAPDGGLLLTLGDINFSGLDGNPPMAQDGVTDYGKIMRIDPASGAATVFSFGHRNPQGLAVDRRGRIWNSEHGPQGGDEVNLVVQGGNYGWPLATYGTNYGTKNWPLDPDGMNHGAFREPAIAFVPSIATSALIEVRGDEFSRWDGDLLLATLRSESLYRLRLRDDRVIYAEPIRLGVRIRDLTQTPDGRIFAWSDAGIVIEVGRSARDDAFATACAGCHAPTIGAAAGPSLVGVIGRDIASMPDYPYSDALKALDGVWTEAALDAFLRDPGSYAPGTAMNIGVTDDAVRAEVIAYLAAQTD